MKINLLKNASTATFIMFATMFFMPVKIIAQSDGDLSIGGEKVTALNANDLSAVAPGVSGTIKYEAKTKTLTLQNATIDTKDKNPIESHIDGLIIKVVGTNTVKSSGFPALLLHKPATIMGEGTLNLGEDGWVGIFLLSTSLTIEDCTVNAKGTKYGINGLGGQNDKVVIKNATVTADGKGNGSIRDISGLTLIGCSIVQPTGAEFDPMLCAVILDDKVVKDKVVISNNPTAIAIPTGETIAAQGIYTLNGQRISADLKDLPKGVYIVNGQKVVKK